MRPSSLMMPLPITLGWIFWIAAIVTFWLFPVSYVLCALSLLMAIMSFKHGVSLIILNFLLAIGLWFVTFQTEYVIFSDTFKSWNPAEQPKNYKILTE